MNQRHTADSIATSDGSYVEAPKVALPGKAGKCSEVIMQAEQLEEHLRVAKCDFHNAIEGIR